MTQMTCPKNSCNSRHVVIEIHRVLTVDETGHTIVIKCARCGKAYKYVLYELEDYEGEEEE